jgi:uncharacterized protein (TIGR02996 family)
MTQDEAFIADILAHPEEPELRLIYADWLEEQGDWRAEYLRLQATLIQHRDDPAALLPLQERLRLLRPQLAPGWVARLDQARVELCHVPLERECPAEWEKMQLTEEPTVRFCETCRKHIYYCTTLEEVRRRVGPGHCIAVDSSLARRADDTWRRVPGFPRRSFFFPPGTFVRILAGELAGREGIIQTLFEANGDIRLAQADIRLRGEGKQAIVRVLLRHLECSDRSPIW